MIGLRSAAYWEVQVDGRSARQSINQLHRQAIGRDTARWLLLQTIFSNTTSEMQTRVTDILPESIPPFFCHAQACWSNLRQYNHFQASSWSRGDHCRTSEQFLCLSYKKPQIFKVKRAIQIFCSVKACRRSCQFSIFCCLFGYLLCHLPLTCPTKKTSTRNRANLKNRWVFSDNDTVRLVAGLRKHLHLISSMISRLTCVLICKTYIPALLLSIMQVNITPCSSGLQVLLITL